MNMLLLRAPLRPLTIVATAIAASGCALSVSGADPRTPLLRDAVDAPPRFEVIDPGLRVPPADTIVGQGCRSPLVDPRDQTRLRMVRAGADGVGDYEVPEGRYGVSAGEVLRVECNTGEVLGIARRQRSNP